MPSTGYTISNSDLHSPVSFETIASGVLATLKVLLPNPNHKVYTFVVMTFIENKFTFMLKYINSMRIFCAILFLLPHKFYGTVLHIMPLQYILEKLTG